MMQLREPEIQEMSRVLNKQPALKKRLLQEYYLGYSPDTVSGRGFDKMPALTAEIERRKKMNESFNLKINAAAKRGDTATVDRLKAQLKSENPLDILHELNPRMNSKHREHLYSVLDRESMVPQELAELNEYNENTKKWKEMQREERIAQHQLGESRKAAKKAINNGSTNNTTTGTPKEVAKDVINTDSKLKGTLLNRDPNAPLKTNVTGEPVLKGKMAPKATETAKEVAKDVISGAHATATPSTTHTPIIASGGGGGGHSPSTTHTPSTTATPNTTHTPIIASGGGGGGSGSYHAPTSKKVAPNKFRYGKHLLAAGLVGGAGYGLHRYMNRDK
jgi:hypothetical protein